MCQFYSCIIDRNLKVYDSIEIDDSHETTIEKFKLNDKKLENRDIVRLELNPNWKELMAKFKKSDWNYKVDENGTLPLWLGRWGTPLRLGRCGAPLRLGRWGTRLLLISGINQPK